MTPEKKRRFLHDHLRDLADEQGFTVDEDSDFPVHEKQERPKRKRG